jgi:type I restriction-modification system DNA methylase subunit
MSFTVEQLQSVMAGSQENRIEGLRQLLAYPLKQGDPEGSRFWYLRPGADVDEAQDTCPIAVGFYSELDGLTHGQILQFLTAEEQQKEIYGHYIQRIVPNQPVMYLLLPEGEGSGRVAMVLPAEGKLRQRQIQSFAWSEQDLQARLNRLRQSELAQTNRMQENTLAVIPLVEWAFYKPIATAKELATKLAEVSRKIEQAIPTVYDAERQDGYLHGLLTSFQRELLPTLKLKPVNDKDYSFADIYAQTIAYGLFTARVFSYTVDERKRQEDQNPERKETDFNRQNAWERLPETNPFLRRLFRDVSQQPIAELGEDLVDAITEVFSILRAAKMDAILADFRAKMNREDIVIRFHEDFLAAYKPQMRERRGVYYTPEPVVSYMVRSVDILLKEKFDKPLGLADPEVMILDPACGTGTFLLWIFQEIYRKFEENPDLLTVGLEDKSWSGYVKERLLPRIFGFELLMAPYAIAHLKLGLFLEETGYQSHSGKRLGVYLTNTLDDATKKSEILLNEFIADEANEAAGIKRDMPVMVVVGNPPYSVSSSNKSRLIESLVARYKKAVRDEKNIQPLSDDYIKFLCFAHHQIERTGYGVICFK